LWNLICDQFEFMTTRAAGASCVAAGV